ncbi:keratin-associated protein 21-1-like [Trichoplusia ni]|uniref:Keratin-associated protein 21-1-like n=1 Tax=Trichoplusia ni TaxID=7111 RepID=A0A7E5WNF5_TRINI|nr:keratin-associated protein 21-1-like [Trichoplusia ni]
MSRVNTLFCFLIVIVVLLQLTESHHFIYGPWRPYHHGFYGYYRPGFVPGYGPGFGAGFGPGFGPGFGFGPPALPPPPFIG